jgi:hypothetical protein
MGEEAIHILPTNNTPEVIIGPDGIIKIKGRALMINNSEILEPLMNGVNAYLFNPPEKTNVIVAIEYLNSFSSTILISILKKLSQAILHPKKLAMLWYYEKDDEDMLELGKYISEICNIPAEFVLATDITDL